MLPLPYKNGNSWVGSESKFIRKIGRTLAILLLPLELIVLEQVNEDKLQNLLRQKAAGAGVEAVAEVNRVIRDGSEMELIGVNLLALTHPALRVEFLSVLIYVVVPVQMLVRERDPSVGREMKSVAESESGDGTSLHSH